MKSSVTESGSDLRDGGQLVEGFSQTNVSDGDELLVASESSDKTSQSESGTFVRGMIAEHEQTVISKLPVVAPAEFYRSMPLCEVAKILEGRQLDHFLIEQMIGGGGMGAVFRGRDLRLDRTVAIKVIPASKGDADTLRRFRMEAQSAARLDHPNIARVYYIGETEDWNYIAFEFIEGINLRDLVDMEGPLSVDDAVFYTRQIAEALQHASDRNVVHRDIKPSNILITPTGIAKVVDMGLARSTSLDRSTTDLTASGVTLGTFDYISPEQARNPRDADVRSDLYSLGCALFFMLAGRPPFPEGTALQKLLNHGSQPPPDLRQWRDDLSNSLCAVLMKLMAKRPVDRYQKPTDLINDLLLLAESEGLQRSRTPGTILLTPTIAERSLWEANIPWLVAVAVLLCSGFWLQSAASLTDPFELHQPDFTMFSASGSSANDPLGGTLTSAPSLPLEAPQIPAFQNPNPSAPNPSAPNPSAPSSGAQPILEGPLPSSLPAEVPSQIDLDHSTPPVSLSHSNSARSESSKDLAGNAGSTLPVHSDSHSLPTSKFVNPRGLGPTQGIASESISTRLDDHQVDRREVASDDIAKPSLESQSLESSVGQHDTSKADTTFNSAPLPSTDTKSNTIHVSASEPSNRTNRMWSASLSEAIARAATMPEVQFIELSSDVVVRGSISIPRDGLTIRGATNEPVEIRLSAPAYIAPGKNEACLEIGSYDLELENVSVTIARPGFELSGGFTVFGLAPGGQLTLSQCKVTIHDGSHLRSVHCVSVREATVREANPTDVFDDVSQASEPLDEPRVAPRNLAETDEPATLRIRNCVVRGQFTFLGVQGNGRVEVAVDQSLFALSESVIATIPEATSTPDSPAIRLLLKNSTFACGNGFCRLALGSGLLSSVCLNRSAESCVFWSPSSVPHITLACSGPLTSIAERILLKGEDNAYDQGTTTSCQLRPNEGGAIDYGFVEGLGTWFREGGNEYLVRWQNPLPSVRAWHEIEVADFKLRSSMFMPGYLPNSQSPPNSEF